MTFRRRGLRSSLVRRAAGFISTVQPAACLRGKNPATRSIGLGFSLALSLTFLSAGLAQAADFAIELTVQVGKASKTAREEKADIGVKPKKREVLRAKAGDKVQVRWVMTNRDPKATVKNVLVHFFAVKEDELGQKVMPKLDKGVLADTALIMDFSPKDQAKGELNVTVPRSGPYLFRLETIGAAVADQGQEYFAALELLVEER